ncbi:MAG TPA: adenylate/guanylate cyclase domain-containing protein [Chitinophagaceae bacterium]
MNPGIPIFEELRREKQMLSSLFELKVSDTTTDPDYDRIARVAAYVCEVPIALVSFIEHNRLLFRSRVGWHDSEAPREFFCSYTMNGDVMMEVPDTLLDERFRDHPLVTGYPNIRFYAGLPLVTSDGLKLGTLCVMAREPKTLTEEQEECLETLARQIVVHIELKKQQQQLQQLNAGLLQDLQQRIEQKDKILKLFSRFVPPEVISQQLHGNNSAYNDAELKYCAILFCDIRSYTSMVEGLPPAHAVAILNTFYTIMSDVIKTYSGVVVQYVGDEIFAIFGQPFSFPQYERNAVFCAIEMMKRLDEVNEICMAHTGKTMQIGIGINAGEVITGTLGSDEKIEFCVTGDHVNTAKRIESLTREKPNSILVSESVYEKLKGLVEFKAWEPMRVKGKSQPLSIYEVTGKKQG